MPTKPKFKPRLAWAICDKQGNLVYDRGLYGLFSSRRLAAMYLKTVFFKDDCIVRVRIEEA